MPITNVTSTLRTLLHHLEAERRHLDHQIAAIRNALDGATGPGSVGRIRRDTKSARPRMGAAARRADSQRIKAYWAKGKPKANQYTFSANGLPGAATPKAAW